MRFEKIKQSDASGNWYELHILPATGASNDFYILVSWGPAELILQEKHNIYKGPIDSVMEEITKIKERLEKAGYTLIETQPTQ
jgi:hypothetical protein